MTEQSSHRVSRQRLFHPINLPRIDCSSAVRLSCGSLAPKDLTDHRDQGIPLSQSAGISARCSASLTVSARNDGFPKLLSNREGVRRLQEGEKCSDCNRHAWAWRLKHPSSDPSPRRTNPRYCVANSELAVCIRHESHQHFLNVAFRQLLYARFNIAEADDTLNFASPHRE